MLKRTFKVAICRAGENKFKDFEALATQFVNLDLTQAELASEINRGYAFTTHHQGRRKAENFVAAGFIALDFDKTGTAGFEAVINDPLVKTYPGLFYFTPSSTEANPRFRLIFELEEPIYEAEDYRATVQAFIWKFGQGVDESCKDPTRFFYGHKFSNPIFGDKVLPMTVVESVKTEYQQFLQSQKRAEVSASRKTTSAHSSGELIRKRQLWAKSFETICQSIESAPKGDRHATLLKYSRTCGGYLEGEPEVVSETEVTDGLERAYSRHPELSRKEMKAAIEDGIAHGRKTPLYLDLAEPVRDFPPPPPAGNTTSTQGEVKAKKLYHADELHTFPEPIALIGDELMRSSLALLVGESGCGKSFIAHDYSLRVAQTETVIYIAGEGAAGYHQRIEAWRKRYTPEACNFYLWPEPLQITDSAVVAGFLVEIEPLKPALIVLDTLARSAIGLDENSARDMGQFVAVCDWIKRSTGACVLVVHHTGKSGTSERGSSALRGAADTLIKVTPEDSLRKISCEKMKDGPEFADRFIELVACENSLVVEPAESGQGRVTSTLTKTQREILRVLVLEAFIDSGASANRIMELSGYKPSATFSALSSLKRKGYVEQNKKGDPWKLLPAGEFALEC